MASRHVLFGNDDQDLNVSTCSFTLPSSGGTAPVAGDVLVVVVSAALGSTQSLSISGGGTGISWNQRVQSDQNNNHKIAIWTATAVSDSAGKTVTVTATQAARLPGVLLIRTGGVTEAGSISADGGSTTADTAMAFPTATTGADVLALGSMRIGSATQPSVSAPAGSTVLGQANTAFGAGPNLTAFAGQLTSPPGSGSATPGTFTASAAVADRLFTLVLAAGAAPTTANAGPNLVNLEPFSTATLTALDEPPVGSTQGWSQISGSPTVTLTGTGKTRTFPVPATMDGTTLGFRRSLTVSGVTTTDDMTATVYPHNEWAFSGGVLVPARAYVVTDAPDPALRGLGYIGDGLTWQLGSGKPREELLAAGWPALLLEVDGLPDRGMAVGGVTHPNVGEVIDAWRAAGFDPYTWVIAVGSHNLNATDASWTTLAGEVLDKIAAGPRVGYVVNWVGISLRDGADTRPPRFIDVLEALVGTRPKVTLHPLDWNAYVHNGRDETGLWDSGDSVGRYMTSAGYDLRNAYVSAQIGAPT